MKSVFIFLFITLPQIPAESIISANNFVTADLYKELVKLGDNNFLVSPFSAETIFALAQSGAQGQTQQELRTTLRLSDQNQTEADFKSLLPKLKSEEFFSLHTANKLYLKENFEILEEFKRVATEVFGADLENIDFSQNVEAAKTMNQWVEKQTQNKIHDLITSDKLNADTRAVIINALYFKGSWASPFRASFTTKKDFHNVDKSVAQVETMQKFDFINRFSYAENDQLKATFLEMPFQGEGASMVVVLPQEKDGIVNVENQIDKVFLEQNFTKEFVNVSIPKFKIESAVDLKKILQNLGVKDAFIGGKADFRGITGDKNLFISDAFQKTFIDVNEAGVEAAAASYAIFNRRTGHGIVTDVKEFHADHPFIYYIKINGLIMFAGKVGAPTY